MQNLFPYSSHIDRTIWFTKFTRFTKRRGRLLQAHPPSLIIILTQTQRFTKQIGKLDVEQKSTLPNIVRMIQRRVWLGSRSSRDLPQLLVFARRVPTTQYRLTHLLLTATRCLAILALILIEN
jgi:hypothetical protein